MPKGPLTGVGGRIGSTPLVELRRIAPPSGARILDKLEGTNPTGSVKDRIALAMVEAAEAIGLLKALRHRRRNLLRWRPKTSAMTVSQGAMFESERLKRGSFRTKTP
jgi:threonine synthase